MALDLLVKVFVRIADHLLEAELQRWLAHHADVEVRFISQSEHVEGTATYITISLFYTEPTDRQRAMQTQMRETSDA
jgi:hypothetical protein